MANPASPAGDNGVSMALPLVCPVVTLLSVPVAKTSKGYGSAVADSTVTSETLNLRFAYSGVECDSPAIDRGS